jgi:hypothetical protein
MPRDASFPPPMPLEKWQDEEAHNAWVLEIWSKWGREGEPRPCDCGVFPESETRLSSCTEEDRFRCHASAKSRLVAFWKAEREKEVRAKRTWPGPEPHADAPPGHCWWCGLVIMREDGFRMDLRRRRHPECFTQLIIRLRPDAMRRFVWRRDGGRCARPGCGKVHSLFGHWDADHIRPLYFAEGDLSFWAPENVVILCRDPCHKLKSREDIALIAAHRAATKTGETKP